MEEVNTIDVIQNEHQEVYNFPFDTCEECNTNGIIKQPYSFTINLISSIILLILAILSKSFPVRITLLSYSLFELCHSISHAIHISGNGDIQKNTIHYLGYFMAFTTLYAILYLSKSNLTYLQIFIILIAIIIDQISYKTQNTFAMFTTGILLFSIIIIIEYNKLPQQFKDGLLFLIPGIIIIWILFYNESKNCKKMLKWKNLPYHVLIEIMGLVLFTIIGVLFYRWDLSNVV